MVLIKSRYKWHKIIDDVVSDKDIFETIHKNRDIEDYEAFFSMGVESIHDPYLFRDMDKAVNRIQKAISDGESILVFGDYDCDGITSVSIIYRMLRKLGAKVSFMIPDRFEDGYGMNMNLVNQIVAQYQLVITVDNGISSVDEVDFIQDHGIDVIITDHHQFKDKLPKAYAILHTELSEKYPFKPIAGCMVAFKLAWALNQEFPHDLTDLAMIGTIADLMPLEDENQAMVNIGLSQLKETSNMGLRKLLTFSNLDIINQTAIAFQIAPKINSSGRLNQADLAVKLLISDDLREANELISQIEENHEIRKRYTEESFRIAEKLVDHDDQVLVLASPKFYEGVIGICAQRISEKYQKPTIVLVLENGMAKGSARSFGKISILNMLREVDDCLEKYGGHDQAAGMQLKEENVLLFKQRLNELKIDDSEPVLEIDMEVDLDDVSKETVLKLQENSFHTALFLMRDLRVVKKQIIGKKHFKMTLASKFHTFEALKFNQISYYYNLNENDVIDVVGGLTINRFRNRESVQIMLTDLRCHHFQVLDYRRSYKANHIREMIFSDFTILSDEIVLASTDIKALMTSSQSFALFPREHQLNFNLLLDRNEMIKAYLKLKKLRNFNKFDIIKVLKIDEWSASQLILMYQDLHLLVKCEDGYQIQPSGKSEMSESNTYQDILSKKNTIDWLYQSTVDRISNYLEGKHGLS